MKVYLRTFGCRANRYDTEQVRAMVIASGGTIVDEPDAADVAVFNSCAVTADAEADLRRGVRRAARQNPSLRTVVMGCAAGLVPEAIRTLPTVSDVVPGADLSAIASSLNLPHDAWIEASLGQSTARAVLRIQDGCDEHCTFCATTLARGANRSRTPDAIVREAIELSDRHAEIVITGIHIGGYGKDIGATLGSLMDRLVQEVPRARFRLSSIEATEVDDRLAELFAAPLHLVPYLHAPLQSGSDRILRRMGRHWYTSQTYSAALRRITAGRSVFGLGADVIAGFPGESEEDHAATMRLVAELPFTSLHVFTYSERPGTAAARMSDRADSRAGSRRATELRVLALEKAAAYRSARAGGVADVVVVGDRGKREGVTEDYLTVSMAGPAPPRGERCRARLLASANALVAHPL